MEEVDEIDFLSADETVARRVKLPPPDVARVVIKKSRDDKVTVVAQTPIGTARKDAHVMRSNSATRVTWFGPNGAILGERNFAETGNLVAISEDGSRTAILDVGFDPEELSSADIVKNRLAIDSGEHIGTLTDHKILVLDPQGKIVFSQLIPGPAFAPRGINLAPSGQWLVFANNDHETIVQNLRDGRKESVAADPLLWDINDEGTISGWQLDSPGGEVNSTARKKTFRKFVRKLGEPSVMATEELVFR